MAGTQSKMVITHRLDNGYETMNMKLIYTFSEYGECLPSMRPGSESVGWAESKHNHGDLYANNAIEMTDYFLVQQF